MQFLISIILQNTCELKRLSAHPFSVQGDQSFWDTDYVDIKMRVASSITSLHLSGPMAKISSSSQKNLCPWVLLSPYNCMRKQPILPVVKFVSKVRALLSAPAVQCRASSARTFDTDFSSCIRAASPPLHILPGTAFSPYTLDDEKQNEQSRRSHHHTGHGSF